MLPIKKLAIKPKKIITPNRIITNGWSSSKSPYSNQQQHHLQVKIPKLAVDAFAESQDIDVSLGSGLLVYNNLAAKKRYSSIYAKANQNTADINSQNSYLDNEEEVTYTNLNSAI